MRRGAVEAEPGGHDHRNESGIGCGARGRLADHRLGSLRRDRGCDDRPSRGGMERRPAQGRLLRPIGADGEMERGATNRSRSRRRRLVRRMAARMKAVLQYRATARLRRQIAALDVPTVIVDETDKNAFRREMRDADILLHVLEPVTAEVIDTAPRLRLIQKIGVGVNTIDLDAARRRGIAVGNMPGTNTQAVAELTLLLMLATLRRLTQLDRVTRSGYGWKLEPELSDDLGELSGRTVGLVGFGAVARRLVPMLQAIGARVLYTSRQPAADSPIPFVSLLELLPVVDVLSLHLPL